MRCVFSSLLDIWTKTTKNLKIFSATFGKKDDLTDPPYDGVFQYFRSYKSSLNTGHATTWLEPAGSSPWRQAEKSSTFPVLYGRFTCKQNGQKCLHVPQNCVVFFFGTWKMMACLPSQYASASYLRNCVVTWLLLCLFSQELLRLGRALEVPDRCQQTALLGTKSGALVQPCKSDRCSERGKLSYTLALYWYFLNSL